MGACEWLRINTVEDRWGSRTTFNVMIYSHNFMDRGVVIATGDTAQEARKAAAEKLRDFTLLLWRGEGKP